MKFALATVETALASHVRVFDWEMTDGAKARELDMEGRARADHEAAGAAAARRQAGRVMTS
ncbi:hypothetical protein PR202_gb01288 [Eleusine coracana subsp. coracana]|uniref:Uncharacterized protein n=1 Tax=Eleusine coracana subsp. coracana TaxID=191504 RepID=A0AAV5DW85_ELECO|nr:hypothetical protein PR202_gb01288 [Eleusine coracana subsp. coracana]